jgi:CubicO group peptidase (beta-lactamase class C family)
MRSRRIPKAPFALVLLLGFFLMGLHPAAAQEGPTDRAEVEAFMDGLFAAQMAEKHIPGAVAIVVKGGRILFTKGYGFSDLQTRHRFDPAETLFRAGSVSKLFVWTAVMQLVERGALSLDEDVNGYIDFQIPAAYAEPVTLRALMSHTAGFEERSVGLFRLDADHLPSLEAYLKTNLPARVFPPHRVGAYSNYGAALAGYIVERVSHLPFSEYVERNIFLPLGMTRSTFLQPLPPSLIDRLSLSYNFVDGEYLKGDFEYVAAYPAGSLSTTALDLARFMIMHLHDGRYDQTRILEEATARRMHGRSYSADPRITGMAHGFFESAMNGRRVISHGGDTFLFHSALYLLPEHKVGLFIAVNAAGGANTADEIASAFLDRYFPAPVAPQPTPTDDFSSRAKMYEGEFYVSRSNFTTVEKILSLVSRVNVSIDDKNEVLISADGRVDRYVEVEPGLLVNKFHPHDKMVLKEEGGRIYLHSSGPTAYVKTPWYGSSGLHLWIFIGALLLFTGTTIGWGFAFFSKPPKERSFRSSLPRLLGGALGLSYIIFLVMFLNLTGDMHPVYGVPEVLFTPLPWSFLTMKVLPALIWFLGIGMWPPAAIAWINGKWSIPSRLFYTFFIIAAFIVLWVLAYWNIIF